MRTILIVIILFISCLYTFGQVAINADGSAPDSSAILDLNSNNKGFLPPRLSNVERDGISDPTAGLMIFNTDVNQWQGFNGTSWINTDGTSCAPAAPGSISGNYVVSENATGEVYTITAVAGATSYFWAVPDSANITTGQGTTTIIVDFGSISGDVSVRAENGCGNSSYTDLLIFVGNLTIGESFQGGILAYIFQVGDPGYVEGEVHGFIVSTADLSTIQWTTNDYWSITVPGGATSYSDGWGNSNAIVAQAGADSTYAAGLCRAYSATGDGGLNDWYLPSQFELNILYINRNAIGGLIDAFYWSSTEVNNSQAWMKSFYDGVDYNNGKSSPNQHVRAIRAF